MRSTLVFTQSELIAEIRPYQWVIALFGLTPPPFLLTTKWRDFLLPKLIYRLYEVFLIVFAFYATYVNNAVVKTAIPMFDLDAITVLLSVGLNVSAAIAQLLMQVFSIFGGGQLLDILLDIAQLEVDINEFTWSAANSVDFKRTFGIRFALATRSLVLMVLLIIILPYVSIHLVAYLMSPFDQVVSVIWSLIIQIKCVEYCIVVQLVQELLFRLQEDLKLLRVEISRYKSMPSLRYCAALQQNQQLLARVWNLVSSIESHFSTPLLVLFLYNGLAVTQIADWAYTNFYIGVEKFNVFRLFFTFAIFGNMMLPSFLGQSCIDSYNHFGAILHSMKFSCLDTGLRIRLREYSLQLMHQKLRFTCGGFFDINLGFFGKLVLTVSTYVVILIQFKMQGRSDITVI